MITVDTNIFVYSVDDRERKKQPTAELVVARLPQIRAAVGLQVVGEFQNVAARRLGLSAATGAIEALARGELSYWDALLLASASEAGCTAMLSEDMRHQEAYFGVRVVNPFTVDGGLSPGARSLLEL